MFCFCIRVCVCVCVYNDCVFVFLQGADKERKGPDGLSALEAAESEAIKNLLK